MEEWQIKHITQSLNQLIELTTFNCSLKAFLIAKNILSKADVDKLDAVQRQNGDLETSRLYYQLLLTRKGAYKVLYEGLKKTKQSGAYTILIRVSDDLFRKPLTYLGIQTALKTFQDMHIKVQGKLVKIKEFFPSVDYKSLQQIFRTCLSELEIYDTFVTGERTFEIASNNLPPKPPYYVPRFLSNRIKIDEFIFKADCTDVFVFKKSIARYKLSDIAKPHFTDTSSSQLNKITCRFIYLDGDEDWNELKRSTKVPIHLINYEADPDIYLLEDSSAPSDILRKIGSREERVYMSEEEFVQKQLSENRTSSSVCICDVPGMGKTFLLANIARLMTDKCAGRLLVFVQLTSFTQEFFPGSSTTTLKPETTLTNVLSYICSSRKHAELLLELVMTELLQLNIFFDGFDEIPTEKVKWTKQVFKSVVTIFPQVRIYISSRPHMRQELEQSLGVVAYDMLPFNQQNQVDFLVQFWQQITPDSDHVSIQSYATTCLKAVNKSLTRNEKEIAGIPLLCQLIAEVYLDKIYLFKRKFLDVPYKISEMYQKFIEKKITFVTLEKKKVDNIKMVHNWSALRLLFPTFGFHKDKQFKTVHDVLTSSEMLRPGILQKHSNADLEFIHRTFAEYLVADYFLTKVMEQQNAEEMNWDSMKILKLLLTCLIAANKNYGYTFLHPVIVSFFNSALVRDPISEELKMRVATFVSFISHEEFIKNLCACCEHNLFNLFCLLTQSLAELDKSRILECFTDENSHKLLSVCIKDSTNQLFQKCIQLLAEELMLDLQQINTTCFTTLLQTAVQCANYEAVEYFVEKISLRNQSLLENCVKDSYAKDDIEKRVNILYLLLNKDPTLIHETQNILLKGRQDLKLFKILVKFGSNLSAANIYYHNCAMNAAMYMSPTDYHEIVQFLLTDCKAEYLFVDNEKWKYPMPFIIERARLLPETLEMLLNIPYIDININDEVGDNLLFYAVKGNKMENFKQLVGCGLDYNERGNKNRSLLHAAAEHGVVEMVRYLLSLKLDPNSCDEDKWTSLHHAAYKDTSLFVVELLVENGANVQAKNNKGQTALHICGNKNFPNTQIIKYLIEKGVGVNDRTKDGNTALHLCWKKEAMDCLIAMGADIHAKNNKGQTVLHISANAYYPDVEGIKYLIGKKLGVNSRDVNGNTPLHLCEEKEVRDCLVEMGADIYAKNRKGRTPAQMNPELWE